MNTSLIKEKYYSHDLLYSQLIQAFEKTNIKINFPISHQVLEDFSKRTIYIYDGITKASEDNNLYSVSILYRSLLEHFFKAIYIVVKMVENKSDNISESYQKQYFILEYLEEQKGIWTAEKLINNTHDKTKFINSLPNIIEELEGFDNKDYKKLEEARQQFNITEVVKFLYNHYKNIECNKNTIPFILQTIPEYSLMSTFTHGGAYASLLMDKLIKENRIEKRLQEIIQISFESICIIKEKLFLCYEIDESFKPYLIKLQELRTI